MAEPILFKFDKQGGFLCGDTATGRTAYAYPTSSYAISAHRVTHRGEAKFVAARMMAQENLLGVWRDAPHFAAKDTERLAELAVTLGTPAEPDSDTSEPMGRFERWNQGITE